MENPDKRMNILRLWAEIMFISCPFSFQRRSSHQKKKETKTIRINNVGCAHWKWDKLFSNSQSSISILKSLKTKTCWKCSRLQEIALRTPFSIWLDFDRVLTSAAHNSYKRCFFFLCNVNIILYTYRFDWPWYWTKLHTLSRWYSTMFFFSLLFIISTARHEPPIISDSISYVLWTSTEMSLFRKKTHTILEIQLDAKQTKETQLTLLLTFSRRLGSAICFSGCAKSLVAI